jgi:hypothetical protein
MTGISFKILVTLELVQAVQRTIKYPVTPTAMIMHMHDIPRPARRLSECLRPFDTRRIVTRFF